MHVLLSLPAMLLIRLVTNPFKTLRKHKGYIITMITKSVVFCVKAEQPAIKSQS